MTLVIEEPCVQGFAWPHGRDAHKGGARCQGTSRTVLTEPTEEMVERVARELDGGLDGGPFEWRKGVARRILTAALFSSDAVAGEREGG